MIKFLDLAQDLEHAGLLWRPEIGDEVAERKRLEQVSVLVDPQGMTPGELRSLYIWLPTVEQIVLQFEVRRAILFHAGLELNEKNFFYKTVIKSPIGAIESRAENLRLSFGMALRDLLIADLPGSAIN